MKKIDDFLSAPEADRIQTRFMTEFEIQPMSANTVDMVKITKLEDDTKAISEAGIDLHDTFTMGVISAFSLHPQLSNIQQKNHALSGSNLREAYEMHIATSTPIMRELLLHAVNTAIKINFPSKNLRVGFQDVAFNDYNKIQTTKPAK